MLWFILAGIFTVSSACICLAANLVRNGSKYLLFPGQVIAQERNTTFLLFSSLCFAALKLGFLPCAEKFLKEVRKWKILRGSKKKQFLDSTSRDVLFQNIEAGLIDKTLGDFES